MMRLFYLIAVVAITFSITGCNTIQGMGKDIEKAGEKIQETAD